jgi:hypothetical protein
MLHDISFRPNLCLKPFNLGFQRFIFQHFSAQEKSRQASFCTQSLRSKEISVAKLVLALAEVAHLDPALFNQGLEPLIQPTQAYTHFFSQLALGKVRIISQQTHDTKVSLLLQLG